MIQALGEGRESNYPIVMHARVKFLRLEDASKQQIAASRTNQEQLSFDTEARLNF
jgi:hypothetical protein